LAFIVMPALSCRFTVQGSPGELRSRGNSDGPTTVTQTSLIHMLERDGVTGGHHSNRWMIFFKRLNNLTTNKYLFQILMDI